MSDDRDLIAASVDDPLLAGVVADEGTTLTPVPVAALRGWRLLDVLWHGPAHPQRWFVAVGDDRAIVLSGHPHRWSRVLDGARVDSADDAVELACAHADATRDQTRGYRRLEGVDDLRLAPRRGPDEEGLADRVRSELRERIAPAGAVGEGPWAVTLWVLVGDSVERRIVEVGRDGSLAVTSVVEADSLPVPVAR